MGTIITIIIGIVIVMFLYYFIKEIVSIIVKKWPAVIWIVGISVGLLLGFGWHWIAGVIGGLLSIGVLANLQESGTKKCSRCGSYDTEMKQTISEAGQTAELWECNKCGQKTIYY